MKSPSLVERQDVGGRDANVTQVRAIAVLDAALVDEDGREASKMWFTCGLKA